MFGTITTWLLKRRRRCIPVPPLQPSAPSAPQPPRPKPVDWPRLSAAPFDPNAPPPPGVREYADARDRWAKIFDGSGCDGAIEASRAYAHAQNRLMLLNEYKFLLRDLADPSSPRRIDFHALPKGARPYLLGPYLGTLVGRAYPHLCWETSNIGRGTLTYIFPGGPAEPDTWRKRLGDIRAWLGDTWTMGNATANTITLIRRPPLPDTLPFTQRQLQQGALFLGIDTTTHQPAQLPFANMTSGTFIPGASGTGKSNALNVIVRALIANAHLFSAIYLIDGKQGVTFNRLRHALPGKLRVLWEEPEVWKLAADLTATMRQRNEAQRQQGIDNAASDFIAVVIDEMATFTARPSIDPKHPDTKLHTRFVDDLTALARRGRSTGLRLIISAQEPVVEQIPASVRANCLTTLAFRLPIDAHATAVFGQLDTLPSDPRRLPRGHALLKDGLTGDIREVRFPLMGRAP